MVAEQSHESVHFTDAFTSRESRRLRSLDHGRPRVAVEGEGGRLSGAASLHVLAPGHTRAEVTALYRESDALDDAIRIAEDMERWNSLQSLTRARRDVEERIALATRGGMMAKLKACPICGGAGIGPFPVGETGNPGELFYATTVCDHIRVGGRTEEEVIEVFNRRSREKRLVEALRAARGSIVWGRRMGNGKLVAEEIDAILAEDAPVSIPRDIADGLCAYLSARQTTSGGFPMETHRAEADGVDHLLAALRGAYVEG